MSIRYFGIPGMEFSQILREADIMFGLCHPNVVRIVEVIDDSRSDTNLEVLFPREYCARACGRTVCAHKPIPCWRPVRMTTRCIL